MSPRILLATLCLNEMEWLPRLYAQHKDWPGIVGWCFVEAADAQFAKANPGMVMPDGLSVDRTPVFLTAIMAEDSRVHYLPLGVVGEGLPQDQGKVAARNAYMQVADDLDADWLMVLDADEFYTHADQAAITKMMAETDRPICLPQRHIWLPPSLQEYGFAPFGPVGDDAQNGTEVVGGYWAIPHCRVWPHRKGNRYRENHNYPELPHAPGEVHLAGNMMRLEDRRDVPQCVHMGFASSRESRQAKNAYYVERGEGRTDRRGWYVECRRAWETWRPGDALPHGARVVPYDWPVPEVFR